MLSLDDRAGEVAVDGEREEPMEGAEVEGWMFEDIHAELAALASYLLRQDERHVSLHTHDLVGEAIARLLGAERLVVDDPLHLKSLAARAMRRVLIDRARKRNAEKRSGQRLTLRTDDGVFAEGNAALVRLDEALIRLKVIDADRAHLVELRYFGGLSISEAAEVLGTSPSTVERSWRATRAWLKSALEESLDDE
ncbi:ECF-type sigma factor [Parvularcula maris]|uniref:ECF-type sigma factor n=1 Tax=Parvularcula maris TaxID=2965077 RepID=A0A9X2LB73_9PROT|nr:ECF-type sigma factor [Parvularcula maris]MCQ8186462.1 ECF-type sigma factor [Parvularcula maris]